MGILFVKNGYTFVKKEYTIVHALKINLNNRKIHIKIHLNTAKLIKFDIL